MFDHLRLSHLVFAVRDLARWRRFAGDFLGLPEPVRNTDGSLGYRIDGQAQRLILTEGESDDLAAIGWEVNDEQVLGAIAAAAAEAGAAPEEASADCGARRVARLVRFSDPAGNINEIVIGPEQAASPFQSEKFPSGFRTGAMGLGHAVLVARDRAGMERFYRGVFGFGVSQRLDFSIGPIGMQGTFLYANPRHHSLALFDMPVKKRLQHFMLEAVAIQDVGMALERARKMKVPVTLDLGQHPAPDGTLSFYGRTPSGFEFEVGTGSGLLPEGIDGEVQTVTSDWGHRPSLSAKLRMAGTWAVERLGLAA